MALYADRLFFRHLAQEISRSPNITEDDISEAAREYLNVICGRHGGKGIQTDPPPTTFRFPVYNGDYCVLDSELECFCKSQYINEDNEGLTGSDIVARQQRTAPQYQMQSGSFGEYQ